MQAVTLSRIPRNASCQVMQISISKYPSKGFTLKLNIITQCYDSDVNSVKLRIDGIVICSFGIIDKSGVTLIIWSCCITIDIPKIINILEKNRINVGTILQLINNSMVSKCVHIWDEKV